MTDANEWLMSGGVPTAKFPSLGTTVHGTITDAPQVRQQTDFDTGALLYWDDGNKREQLVINLQTDERDPALTNDDGVRATYVKGQNIKSLRDAIRAAGADGIEAGGYLWDTYVKDGVAEGRKNPPKLHEYKYRGPGAQAANALIAGPAVPASSNGTTAHAVVPPAPGAAPASPAPQAIPPAAAAPAPAAAAGLTEVQKAALAALGIDPAQVPAPQ
jgi:hypothetical protein